jgi:hypothetical protein
MLIGALAAGLSGCASPAAVPVPEQLRSNLLALASLPPELELAHRVVARSCMSEAGFDLPFDSSPPRDFGGTLIGVAGLFSSEESARATGYASTVKDLPALIDQYEEDLSAAEGEKYRLAYFGGDDAKMASLTLANGSIVERSAEGCTAEADIAVYGSVEDTLKAQNFVNEVQAQSAAYASETSADLGANIDEYKTCMSSAGYSVNGLNASEVAASTFGKYRSPSEAPSAEEQDMAASDFACQKKTGISVKLDEIFLKKSSTWIVQNEGLIIGTREIVEASRIRARAIING